MSFENLPESEKLITPPAKSKGKWQIPVIIFLVLSLLGTWAYIIYQRNTQKEAEVKKDTLIATVSLDKDRLQKELDDASALYDQLKTSNAKKDSTISTRDKDIAAKKMKIQSLLSKQNATAEELTQARELIKSLNTDIVDYKTQVDKLKQENTQLTQEKNTITEERNVISQHYDSATNVIREKEKLIDVGSTLHASNFSVTGINEKKNGKEKETTTAKRVDKLRIAFNLDENRITSSGEKELFICINSPEGTILAVEAFGSGKFNLRDGSEKIFTKKLTVNYNQGQRQTIQFDWKQNADYETGDYKIEVYQNGFKIGEGVCHFKKGGLFS